MDGTMDDRDNEQMDGTMDSIMERQWIEWRDNG